VKAEIVSVSLVASECRRLGHEREKGNQQSEDCARLTADLNI
jgi:hypothetical protein